MTARNVLTNPVPTFSRGWAGQKPRSGHEDPTPEHHLSKHHLPRSLLKRRCLVSNPDYSSQIWCPVTWMVFSFSKTHIIHKTIHIIFVFTFKYKNTILLCVINQGPSNMNLFFFQGRDIHQFILSFVFRAGHLVPSQASPTSKRPKPFSLIPNPYLLS